MLQNDFWEHVVSDTKEYAEHLLGRVRSRQSHAANLALVTDLVHNSNWGYHQSSNVSRTDSWNTFGVHDDQYDDLPQRYPTLSLWEIQLELGEIPDLLSNNLLMPCLQEKHVGSTLSIPQTHSPPGWRLTRQDSDDGDEILQSFKDGRLEGEHEEVVACGGQDSSSTGEPFGPSSPLCLPEPKRVGTTTGEGEGQEHEDEDETEEDKEDDEEEKEQGAKERAKPKGHPVYGMFLCAQDEEGDECRHDRKDSGIFMHSPEDELEVWVQGTLSFASSLTHPSC